MVNYTDGTVADAEQWDRDLDRAITEPQDAYFICHSLGCVTFLRYLLRHNIQIDGVVFVSGFVEKIAEFPQFDDYMQGIEIDKIKSLLGTSFIIASRKDKIINWQITNELSDKLEITLILLPKGGHFTQGKELLRCQRLRVLLMLIGYDVKVNTRL